MRCNTLIRHTGGFICREGIKSRALPRFYSSYQSSNTLQPISHLESWDLESFRSEAFNTHTPVLLPRDPSHTPPACRKWFIHNNDLTYNFEKSDPPSSSELLISFWSDHETTLVPLELTTTEASSANRSTFHRCEAPLRLLLTYLADPAINHNTGGESASTSSIYLAQCPLTSLPASLQLDLSTPTLVTGAGSGSIYASSLWLGRPPTYTPLHRDPNPNLFVQLAGRKTVRLLPPQVGEAIFEHVQERIGRYGMSSRVRGEEMMTGNERTILHNAIWEVESETAALVRRYGLEGNVGMGEALFIPTGWWHSVKGVGRGITASANWWFR